MRAEDLKVILADLENPSFSENGDYKLFKNDMSMHSCAGCFIPRRGGE